MLLARLITLAARCASVYTPYNLVHFITVCITHFRCKYKTSFSRRPKMCIDNLFKLSIVSYSYEILDERRRFIPKVDRPFHYHDFDNRVHFYSSMWLPRIQTMDYHCLPGLGGVLTIPRLG